MLACLLLLALTPDGVVDSVFARQASVAARVCSLSYRAGTVGGPALAALATIGLNAATWLLVAARNRLPLQLTLLHPFIITVSAGVGLRSMLLSIGGRTEWKGRRLVRRKARII